MSILSPEKPAGYDLPRALHPLMNESSEITAIQTVENQIMKAVIISNVNSNVFSPRVWIVIYSLFLIPGIFFYTVYPVSKFLVSLYDVVILKKQFFSSFS